MNEEKAEFTNQNKLIVFQDKSIPKNWYKEEWFYSLVDVVAVLSENKNPTDCLKKYASAMRN